MISYYKFRLFPVRSPLLRESQLLSLPSLVLRKRSSKIRKEKEAFCVFSSSSY